MDYMLDASAFIAFLNDEAGADTVAGLLAHAEDGTDRLFITSIQVLEVYYDRIYVKGRDYADTFLESLYSSSVVILHEVSRDVIREAGRFKTSYSMSLGDTILVATAKSNAATIVSCDHVELGPVEQQENIPFLWIRAFSPRA